MVILINIKVKSWFLKSAQNLVSRSPPCCCCLCLPKAATLNKSWIRFLKGSVYQVPYTESLCLFVLGSLQISGYVDLGSLSFSSPYIYITVFLTLSNMSGLWGLFMFFNVTHQFKLLHNYNYRKKSLVMKIIIVCMNVQVNFHILNSSQQNYGEKNVHNFRALLWTLW